MKKYRFKPRFFALLTATCVLAGGFSIAKIDAACSSNIPAGGTPRAAVVYASVTDEPEPEVEDTLVSLGEFTISHYCCENYPHICNDGDSTYTATGTTPTAGRTIAVDPDVIPYGTEVIIDGHVYVAEDCGGAIRGNRIDVVCATHAEALEKGIYTTEVFVGLY